MRRRPPGHGPLGPQRGGGPLRGAHGGADAAHRARSVFASAECKEELADQFAMRTAEQVAAELGRGPDELFAEWDPVSLASASIG